MVNKLLDILRNFVRICISYIPPVIYRRMLSISILAHQYPNAFKGKTHFTTSTFANGREFLWNLACEEIGSESKLIYLEFGVFNGRSIKYFSKNFVNKGNKFIGLTKIGSLGRTFYCMFDEFFGDENRALEDFKQSYLFKATLLGSGVNSRNSLGQISNRNCLFIIQPL